jgi:hypothetical protein
MKQLRMTSFRSNYKMSGYNHAPLRLEIRNGIWYRYQGIICQGITVYKCLGEMSMPSASTQSDRAQTTQGTSPHRETE